MCSSDLGLGLGLPGLGIGLGLGLSGLGLVLVSDSLVLITSLEETMAQWLRQRTFTKRTCFE